MKTAEPPSTDTAPKNGREPSSTTLGLLALLIALAMLVAVTEAIARRSGGLPGESAEPRPEEAARAAASRYLAAWERADHRWMQELTVPGSPDLRAEHARLLGDLPVTAVRAEVVGVAVRGSEADAEFVATLDVAGLGQWTYRGALPLVENRATVDEGSRDPAALGSWRVAWSPSVVHPALAQGTRLGHARDWPERAPVLALDGTPLTGPDAVDLPVVRAQVVGRTGPASAERADQLGSTYVEGDVVGLSGVQAAFETQLAGRPAGQVLLLDAAGQPIRPLVSFDGRVPAPVHTTIDVATQRAAEAALGKGRPAAVAAVHAPTGEVRAIVSRPSNGFNRALEGRYPPGSTFKVVTAYALLTSGLSPDDLVPCPAATVVAGRRIRNAGGEELGPIPFRTAFYRSCNTAFVEATHERLDPAALSAAAEAFGFNADPAMAVPAAGGSFPQPESDVETVAAAIGQARVTASPLHMATVAGAIASGAWRPSRVTVGPPRPARALETTAATTLQELMQLVVAEGTGTAARLPGTPVAGKTGTAEFGRAAPPRTHAWFIGFRGELAFAVIVEDGGFGGEVAAPIAAAFLAALPG